MKRAGWYFAASLSLCGLGAPLSATHPEVDGGGVLECGAGGDQVTLAWQVVFIAPIKGWILSRDGARIAELPPEADGYVDSGVPPGEHLYVLEAINFTGEVFPIGSCHVVVGDFGVRCHADGLDVTLQWGPILIDIVIDGFVIRRDGTVVGRTPPDVLEFHDRVPGGGLYRYTVHALSAGHEFLIGACTVRVLDAGFICRVDPPLVVIDWSQAPLPAIPIAFFEVFRDGELIGRTEETWFSDRPGPGEHLYEVFAVTAVVTPDDTGRIRVGACKIVMPDGTVPPPEELTCVDLDVQDSPELPADLLLGPHDVLLVWQKPVEYDWVLIARNDHFLARIPGSQFYYVDRNVPEGVHTYSVFGVIGNRISRPARCTVEIPHEPIPPPRELTCQFVGLEEVDPATDPDAAPRGFVVLRWVNGAAYDWVVIVRNGRIAVRLPGDATSYRDLDPPPGLDHYAVFGVIGRRRSAADECDVLVPPGRVPPPEDLTCVVAVPGVEPGVPVDPEDPTPEPPPDSEGDDGSGTTFPVAVFLKWHNPITYDRIQIWRNDALIATLPGDAESFVDRPPFVAGAVVYSVIGLVGGLRSEPATCRVEIGPPFVPPPRDFTCEVLAVETPEPLDPADPGGAVAGEPVAPIVVVRLSWVNPIRYAAILVFRDNLEIARLPGDAMVYFDRNPPAGHHTYGLAGVDAAGNRSRMVTCEVDVPPSMVPPVRDLTCAVLETSAGAPVVILRWRNPIDYDAILIFRDGELIERLPGDAASFREGGLGPGVYLYAVVAVLGNRHSPPAECRVAIDGLPPRNLLYFSSGVFEPVEDASVVPPEVDGAGRITSMASNHDPIQGWSFGVCSDPGVLVVEEATIEGTTAAELNEGAGPTFLAINVLEGGVTMAAIVDHEDPTDVLPPGARHRFLRIRYSGGPEAEPCGRYPVRYCNTLGDPPVAVVYVVQGFEVTPATQPGTVRLPCIPGPFFLRGDANGDNRVEMSDALRILMWLFRGGQEPPCLESADTNGSAQVNIADPVYLLQSLFSGGPPPPPPFPECGFVPLRLGCEQPTCPQPQ